MGPRKQDLGDRIACAAVVAAVVIAIVLSLPYLAQVAWPR